MKKYLIVLVIMVFAFFMPSIHSAHLTDYKIDIKVTSPTTGHVIENWTIFYDPLDLEDLEDFKNSIIKANLNLDTLKKIDPNISPHIFFNKVNSVSIGFNELNNSVRIEYNITDQVLLKYFENDEEILWKFNDNLLRFFLLNDLYHISKESELTITLYDPLVIEDPVPEGEIIGNSIKWTGISSNELRLVAYEKKPPKPSFLFTNMFKNNIAFYFVFFILILCSVLILFFKPKLKKSIRAFVIKNSEIEREKVKKDIFDDLD